MTINKSNTSLSKDKAEPEDSAAATKIRDLAATTIASASASSPVSKSNQRPSFTTNMTSEDSTKSKSKTTNNNSNKASLAADSSSSSSSATGSVTTSPSPLPLPSSSPSHEHEHAHSSSKASNTTSIPSLPKMCLAPCHRFHTNPAISSPIHVISAYSTGFGFTSNNGIGGSGHGSDATHSNNTNKSLKRKQRLAQYKQAQYNNSNTNSSNYNNNTIQNNSAPNNQNLTETSTNATANTATTQNVPTSSSSSVQLSPIIDSIENSCLISWAPNVNFIKNVELLAIASPLSTFDPIANSSSHHNHHQSRNSSSNNHSNSNNNNNNNINNNNSNHNHANINNGSSVFVLVFDEGLFSHNGDFSISNELCDLFGLPTQNLIDPPNSKRKRKEHLQQLQSELYEYPKPVSGTATAAVTTKISTANNTTTKNGQVDGGDENNKVEKKKDDYEKDEKEQEQTFGLRRRVFTNHIRKKKTNQQQPDNDTTNNNNNNSNKDEKKEKPATTTSSTSITIVTAAITTTTKSKMEKLESTYRTIQKDFVKPLTLHLSHEIENCYQIFKNEIMGDGRLYTSFPIKSLSSLTALKHHLFDEDYQPLLSSSSSCDRDNDNGDDDNNDNCQNRKKSNHHRTSTIYTRVGNKAECPVKPTLVFRINLPYSATAMEVTNIEWNADGTSLSIVQRKKAGLTSSAYTSSSASTTTSPSTTIVLGSSDSIFNTTVYHSPATTVSNNKKKKSGNNNSNNNNNINNNHNNSSTLNVLPTSAGNTAVSFWSIPPWLHVDYDEIKMSCENEDDDLCDDGLIIKANNTCEDCGWEVEENDENRSLFPLWEWYLSKYVFKDDNYLSSSNQQQQQIQQQQRFMRKTKILMKNLMEQNGYSMELALPSASSLSNNNSNNTLSTNHRHGKKSSTRGGRTSGAVENLNAMMNGDVTCIFWEDFTPEDEKILGPNAYKEGHGPDIENDLNESKDGKNDSLSSSSDSSKQKKNNVGDLFATPSKWVAIGTSKGQVILHNSAASFLSNHTRKAKSKASGNNAMSLLSSIAAQSRTIPIPVRHKKRVTCGAWVDNLLVFGYIGTGCLTVVSTFPQTLSLPPQPSTNERSVTTSNRFKRDIFDPLFGEKVVKVLGNIMLPGGRDAVNIQIGNIEDDVGSITILSVNCEEKCLLFYTFPKLVEASSENGSFASNVTSSPAMEVSFTMDTSSKLKPKSVASCGNIIFHYMIPNTFLVAVAFSSGFFALVDWVGGIILSDKDISLQYQKDMRTENLMGINEENFAMRDTHEQLLVDVAFHLPTCTAACLTNDGYIVVYHIRIRDGYNLGDNLKAGNFVRSSGLRVSTKTHTRPGSKSKSSASSSTSDSFIDRDSATMLMMGTIDKLCARKLIGRKGYRISFSADGESICVSLGDESVSVFSIKLDDEESDGIKNKLARRIFQLSSQQIKTLFKIIFCSIVMWYFGGISDKQ